MSKTTYRNLKSSNKMLIPVILMMGFVPLIVHMYQYQSGLSQFDWFPEAAEAQVDFFFAWKMIAIILLGVVMLGILLYRCLGKKEKLQFENSFYLLAFYALFVAMSALFSQYKRWVSAGTYELFEPVWVVFAYMIVCYYTYQYVQEEKQVYTLLGWAGVGMLVVTLIGVFQTFGMDFFKSGFGKRMILSPSDWNIMDQINFMVGEKTAYTTLYNPNFLSFFFGMMVPLVACMFIGAKKLRYRIPLAVVEVLAVICLKGSGSDSGWLALVIGIGSVIIILCSRNKKALIAVGAVAVVGCIAVVVVCATTPFGKSLVDSVVGTYRLQERYPLQGIETKDEVVLDLNGNKLHVTQEYNDAGEKVFSCRDDAGNTIATTCVDEANQVYQVNDAKYNGNYVYRVDEAGNTTIEYITSEGAPAAIRPSSYGDGMIVTVDGRNWEFLKADNGTYYYLSSAGRLLNYTAVKSVSLFREDAMSGRGRIWNNTIPVLGKHVFVGAGANTYLFVTPQNDYIYKVFMRASGSYDVKAHCWYLQQWVETGLIGTLLLIAFCMWYVVQSARIYRRVSLHESMTWVGIGVFTAVLVYLVAAVANDSNVCTAPIFWGMLGLGMAINRMIIQREGLFVKEEKGDEASSAKR